MSHAVTVAGPKRARRDQAAAALIAAATGAMLWRVPVAAGWPGLIGSVSAAQALLVVCWMAGLALPGKIGTLLLGDGAAVAADVAVLTRHQASLAPLAGVIAVAFLVMLLHQLCRGVVRVRMTASVSGVAMLVVADCGLAALLVLHRVDRGTPVVSAAVLAMAAALVVANLVDLLAPVARFDDDVAAGPAAPLLAAIAGATAAIWRLHGVSDFGVIGGAVFGGLLGLCCGLLAVAAAYVAVSARPRKAPFTWLAVPALRVLVPLAMTTPVAYLLGQLVLG